MKYASYYIKKNDNVMIISGKEKGKTGRVVQVFPKRERVLIEKVNFIKRHTRPSSKHRQGGIIEKEAPLHISNIMIMCGKCNKAVRVQNKILEDGTRTRVCRKCGEEID